MKKAINLLFMLLLFPFAEAQQMYTEKYIPEGKDLESLKFESKILKGTEKYSIYLPPDYQSSNRRYPVVYLLHGLSDNEMGWIQFGEVNTIADKAIADREIPPVIIVMPDGGVTWYINDSQNQYRWNDMFTQEFIPYIDATYRTRPAKEFRAIAGLSMGGYGALINALLHPDLFSSCVAFSAAVFTDDELVAMAGSEYARRFSKLTDINLKGRERLTSYWQDHSVLNLMKTIPKNKITSVRWYIDCGDDDHLYKGNENLHILMRDLNIPHEYRVRDGAHTWTYWRTGLPDGLKFIGEGFHR